MANTRKGDVALHVKDPPGNIVKPHLLGIILPDFTEWALPYVLVDDDGQVVGDWGGMERVTNTTNLQPWEHKSLQHLAGKPLFKKQNYEFKDTVGLCRTINLPLWQDASNCLDSVRFLGGLGSNGSGGNWPNSKPKVCCRYHNQCGAHGSNQCRVRHQNALYSRPTPRANPDSDLKKRVTDVLLDVIVDRASDIIHRFVQ